MKNPLLILFLAILLTIFVVGFISKQEQNTDEKLFREYLKGFKQAKLPLRMLAFSENKNIQDTIESSFSNEFSENKMSEKFNQFLPKLFLDNSFPAAYSKKIGIIKGMNVILLMSKYHWSRMVRGAKEMGIYRFKCLVVYDKNGIILDARIICGLPLDRNYTNNDYAISDDNFISETLINKDLSFSYQQFSNTGEKIPRKNFIITSAGKIEPKP